MRLQRSSRHFPTLPFIDYLALLVNVRDKGSVGKLRIGVRVEEIWYVRTIKLIVKQCQVMERKVAAFQRQVNVGAVFVVPPCPGTVEYGFLYVWYLTIFSTIPIATVPS